LVAVGMGESDPINEADPEAAENRRVEIINIGP
jgi:flagellar motor protein MotB